MQKSQATAPLSTEENQIYERGYLAGFEAGQLASRDKGAQQNTVRTNGQPFSSVTGNRRSQSQGNRNMETLPKTTRPIAEPHPIQVKKPIKTSPLSDGFPTRKSFENPTITRDIQSRKPVDEPTFTRGFPTRRSVDNPPSTRDVQSRKPIGEGPIARDGQTRRSADNPTTTRDVHLHNQEHEMTGKTTNPETAVQFTTQGHY